MRTSDDIFRTLADANRRRLLELLAGGPRSGTELAASLVLSRSAVSQHLKILREAGLVKVRKAGRQHHYRLDPAPLRPVQQWLRPLLGPERSE